MKRTYAFVLICAVLTMAVVIVAPALGGRPAAATMLTVTAPTGTGTYYPGDEVAVSWTLNAPVTRGYFCVYVMNSSQEQQQSLQVARTRGSSYSVKVPLDVAAGEGYYVQVQYRESRRVSASLSDDSPGTFDVVLPPVPFQTNAWWTSETVVTGQQFAFRFQILNPDPVTISSGTIVIQKARTHAAVTSIAITGTNGQPFPYIVNTTWVDEAPNTYSCIPRLEDGAGAPLPAGSYVWHVLVTTQTGDTNEAWMEGSLTVTRG